MEKLCSNCKWLSDSFSSVCCNSQSEHCADFVEKETVCQQWEKKESSENKEPKD